MIYSLLEQHYDGSWWYHKGASYDTLDRALIAIPNYIKWDETRGKVIFCHDEPLPQRSCYTFDFKNFAFCGQILWAEDDDRTAVIVAPEVAKEIVVLLAKVKEMREAQRHFDEKRITGWMYKVQRFGAEIDETLKQMGI